jgi:hypothetical protein
MSQRRYSKLKFQSQEKILDDADDTDTDVTDDEVQSEVIPNNSADSVSAATPTHSEPPVAMVIPNSPSSEIEHSDPSIVVTRDYYGLAQTVGGNHSCLILITNRSKDVELRDPVVFTKRGYNRIPPDTKIPPERNAYCAFRKPSITIKGTSGVLSYEYGCRDGRAKRFAVLWRIPYRVVQHGGENEVALKWMEVDLEDSMEAQRHTSLELYREMSAADTVDRGSMAVVARQVAKNGKCLHIVNPNDGAELDATFSGNSKAIVKVDFSLPPQIQ